MARDGLQTAAALSVVLVGVFFLLLIGLLVVLILQVRSVGRTVRELGEKGLRQADPVLERGREVADNLAFLSSAVRTDVEQFTTAVRSVSSRLHEASDRMEERVVEFNALMEVVQSEAEDIFIGTASTIRGVRAGTRSLGGNSEDAVARLPEAADAGDTPVPVPRAT